MPPAPTARTWALATCRVRIVRGAVGCSHHNSITIIRGSLASRRSHSLIELIAGGTEGPRDGWSRASHLRLWVFLCVSLTRSTERFSV